MATPVGDVPQERNTSAAQETPVYDCTVCQDLQWPDEAEYPFGMRSVPGFDVLAAAESGCSVCSLIHKTFVALDAPLDRTVDVRFGQNASKRTFEAYTFKRGGNGPKDLVCQAELYCREGQPTKWSKIGPAPDVIVDPTSDECIELAHRWIVECAEKHKGCLTPFKTPAPTRLLDLGSGSGPVPPRLRMTAGQKLTYVALSHRWGSAKAPAAITSRFKRGDFDVPLAELPKTFRDAVYVTRLLGIRYLWIDGFCIDQTSKEDWEIESSRMSSTFQNAFLTIAADAAHDSHAGMFGDPNDRLTVQAKFPVEGPEDDSSFVYVRHWGDRAGENMSHIRRGGVGSYLEHRGWILQERTLCPRTLLFTASELAYECRTHSRCECQGEPNDLGLAYRYMYKDKLFTDPKTLMMLQFNRPYGLMWRHLVGEYTRRQLTEASDLLPALSGLVAKIAEVSGATYVFGLWKEVLMMHLLWMSSKDGHSPEGDPGDEYKSAVHQSRRHQKYHAPSWSWASVVGPIYMAHNSRMQAHGRTAEDELEILDLEYTVAGANPYGPASHAQLTVHGHIANVHLCRPSDVRTSGGKSDDFDDEPLHFGAISDGRAVTGERACGYIDPDIKGNRYEIAVGDAFSLLLVTPKSTESHPPEYDGHPAALLLRASQTHTSCFERVGIMQGRKNNKTWMDWVAVSRKETLRLV